MASSLRELIVSVTADTSRYQREMDRASRMGAQYFRTVREGGADASRSWSTQTAAARTHATAIEAGTQAITRYAGAMAAAIGAGQLVQLADGWTNLNNRLKLVTDGAESFARAQGDVLRIAQATRQPLDATAELYQRIAMNQEALELSGQDLARVVETISKTMVISGTSAAGAQAALVQLGQAFASGTLRGEELNSVLEQAPALAQAISAGLGVPIGKLREMGKAGELTVDQVIGALQKQAAEVDTAFGKMDATIGQAMTNLRTSFQIFVGQSADVSGASSIIAGSIGAIASNMEALATIGGGVAVGALAGKLVQMGTAAAQSAVSFVQSRAAALAEATAMRNATLAAQLKAQADLRRAQAAMGAARGTAESARASRNLAAALLAERQASLSAAAAQTAYARATNVAAGAGRAALGLLGGPAGLAITVGMVAAGWLLFRDNSTEATKALREMAGPLDEVVGKFKELGAAQQMQAMRDAEDALESATSGMRKSIGQLASQMDNFNLRPVVEGIRDSFNAGTISAEEASTRIAAVLKQYEQMGYYSKGAFDDLIAAGAGFEENAKKAEEASSRIDGFKRAQDAAAPATAATTAAVTGQAGALGELGAAASAAGKEIQNALVSLPGQIERMGKSAKEVAGLNVRDWFKSEDFKGVDFSNREDPRVKEAMQQGEKYIRLVTDQDQKQKSLAASTKALSAARKEAAKASAEDEHLASLNQTYAEQVMNLEREIALYGEVGRSAALAYDLANGSLSMLTEAQQQSLINLTATLDAMDDYAAIYDDLSGGLRGMESSAAKTADQMTTYADQAARNIQSYLGDSMFNILDGKFSDIGDSFTQMIKRMLSELAASQLLNMLGGAMSGYAGEGGFGNFIRGVGGSITKGAGKAGGGVAQPRTMMPVAEHGPELLQVGGQTMLMMGAQQGLVSPLMNKAGGGSAMAGGGMQVIINNNGDSKVSARQEHGIGPDGNAMRKLIVDVIADDVASGGRVGQAGKGRYGWQEALG